MEKLNTKPTREESVERVVSSAHSLVRRHLSIRLDAVLETVELPAGVANLDPGLADVDTDALTLNRISSSSGREAGRQGGYHCSVE